MRCTKSLVALVVVAMTMLLVATSAASAESLEDYQIHYKEDSLDIDYLTSTVNPATGSAREKLEEIGVKRQPIELDSVLER